MSQEGILVELVAAEASEWCYRGEGAANIVLAYNGSNPFYMGKVLRLQKTSAGSKHSSHKKALIIETGKLVLSKDEQVLWADWPSLAGATTVESLMQTFAKQVMSPLLGHHYVDPGVLVLVSSQFLESVGHNIQKERPHWRADVSKINISSSTALLMSDHSVFHPLPGNLDIILSSFSVEIKPKCGFLPTSRFIAIENSVKKEVSRFSMHQMLKLSQGQIKIVSCYSPLDLFSGSLERISKAIHDLFANPQNNLHVFVDGKVIDAMTFNANAAIPDWTPLEEALERCISCGEGHRIEILKGLISRLLVETDSLKRLLVAQELDSYDIEGAMHVYHKIYGKCTDDSSCLSNTNNINDTDDKLQLSAPECANESLRDFDCLNEFTLTESRKIVRDYLIAATAKDCSLMLTFQEISENTPVDADTECFALLQCPETGKFFRSKIRFLDLDLKPLQKMVYHHELDQEIVKEYIHSSCQN